MEEQKTEQQPEQPSVPELTITDLINLRTIIDVAVKRGVFGAGEVAGVGTVYNRLDSFITAVTPAKSE
ncbi:MAG: hypothetical protein EBU90_04635 [Proteobacteria bacterium]|nr:hypothetical protein [Pseudomonadota bacterium]NBP13728.1 hypothetical protein [bacterium]